MKILIPTAKELNKKATPQETLELSEKSNDIVAEFAKLSASDLAKVYKIKEDKATEEFSRWKDIKNNTAKSYKALDLFNGLMYRNIDRDNFDEADKEYIEKNVFITTSLYGIIGAYDLIQEHRLDFLQNVKISGESLKNFWRASYDESIKDEDFVVSLLSSEFEEVFSKNQKEKFIKISFMEEKEGKLKVHSTISKKARGKFLTELVKNKVSSVEVMKKIKFDGFEFSDEHSEEKVLAFIAKK
ncbi:MAG: peroxide stress protein YaaA [Gemella haemolysans]|uniref:peroxide stress protein YaaA n=1 Tax=Gemella haemolysans TaxID=1379 RepID=UPI00290974F7|nr:peroxide stress protein YaaA [Gemella haemolysans]MDU6573188.1 peroxide stress protein YaaA [Gemella haemolysans]